MSLPADGLAIEVLLDEPAWTASLPDAVLVCRRAAGAAWRSVGSGAAEACVVLASDAAVRDLNRRFRSVDVPTDVLSFPAMTADEQDEARRQGRTVVLGDVVVAHDTVVAEASEAGRSLAAHLSHLVVHGILHLLGYEHEADADATVMERLETHVLGSLGVADPYSIESGHDG